MDDSGARALPSRERAPGVLLISADSRVLDLFSELGSSNIELRVMRTIAEFESDACREGQPFVEVVFLDLESCDSGEEAAIALIRSSLPGASLIALAGELDCERAASLLSAGVPSLSKPVSAAALSSLAVRLAGDAAARSETMPARQGAGRLDALLEAYSAERSLSKQQRLILGLHLSGHNDKQIASSCSCSEATVYEHWRRMARKAGGMHKACVINDFHRFLDGR